MYIAIHEKDDDFENPLSRLWDEDTCVYGAIRDFVAHRRQASVIFLARLKRLVGSPDYSGDYSRGMRVGRGGNLGGHEQPPLDNATTTETLDHNDELGLDEDEMGESVGQLVHYVSDLSLLPWV